MARVVITPEKPCWIAGYETGRRSEGNHSELFCSVLALDNGVDRMALIALDLIGLPLPTVRRFRREIAGIGPDRVIFACTHTHSGPDTIGLWGPEPGASGVDPAYIEELKRRIVEAVSKALSRLSPAFLQFAEGPIEGVSCNARIPGLIDPSAAVMVVRGADGETMATVAHFACHPEAMHCRRISSDFLIPFYSSAEAGGLGIPLFFNGALGGMVTPAIPPVPTVEDQLRETERVGLIFAARVSELADCARRSALHGEGPLSLRTHLLRFPLENERFRAYDRAGIEPSRFADGQVETELHHLRIGPSEWMTLPGEPTPEIGFYLKRHMTGSPAFVVSLCDDELGYLLTEEFWGTPLFHYESSMCPSPSAARRIEAALMALARNAE